MYVEGNTPTTLACRLGRYLDGTLDEYEKQLEAKMQEWEQQLEAEQLTEEGMLQAKKAEFPDVGAQYRGASVNNLRRLMFTFAMNQYYQTEIKLEPFLLIVDKQGKWNLIDKNNQRDGKKMKYKQNIWQKT